MVEEDVIEYSGPYGTQNYDDTMWDDVDKEFKDDIIKNKIINVKIYYNKDDKEDEKYITGICLTYQNAYTGEIKEIEHKGTEDVSGMKELKIKSDEYSSKFKIAFLNDIELITRITFVTNKGNSLTVGNDEGKEKTIRENDENKIYIGSYGSLKERINSIGAYFIKREVYFKANLFRFVFLRYLINKDEKIKKDCESKYEQLSVDYKFYWRTINLPNAPFVKIIKFCFL